MCAFQRPSFVFFLWKIPSRILAYSFKKSDAKSSTLIMAELWGDALVQKRERETQRPNFLNIKSLPLDRRPSTGFSVAVDGAPGIALPPPPIIFWIKLGPVDCCCC